MGLIVRVALFVGLLFPVVIDQYSVNYLFVVYAAFLAFRAGKLRRPDNILVIGMAVYVLIFVLSLSIDLMAGDHVALRRAVSFGIFMSVFAFAVVDLDAVDVRAFKMALISITLAFSLHSLVVFALVGANGYGFELKNVVGSQRYGFVYLMALFTLFSMKPSTRSWQAAKMAAIYVVLAGLMLTFSRSSIIALLVALPLYWLAPLVARQNWSMNGLRLIGRRAGLGAIYMVALVAVIPVTFHFYGELLFSRYTAAMEQVLEEQLHVDIFPDGPSEPLQDDVAEGETSSSAETSDPSEIFVADGSEGTRLSIWRAVIEHTMAHPLLGAGYLGSWTLDTVKTGSAHNQYFDVLMRTGLPGLAVYLLILLQVMVFLWRKEPGLFWGMLAVLVYGLFHETFKESQGAFILAILIGMYGTHLRSMSGADQKEPAD